MRSILLCLILMLFSVEPLMAASSLEEANASFTYQGRPIHPFLIEKFSNLLSDRRPPIVTTVDVAASFDTNEFQDSIVEKRGEGWFARREEGEAGEPSFWYRWHGKMADGLHVIEAGAGGGGSGVFMDLLFVKFAESEIIWEEEKSNQLLMTVVRTYTLGDRYDGNIEVHPDKVVIHAAKGALDAGAIEGDVELKM